MNKEKKLLYSLIIMLCVMVILVAQLISLEKLKAAEIEIDETKEEIIKTLTGEYTLFQYTNVGWTNVEYMTEYYVLNDFLHFKTKDNLTKVCDLNSFIIVEGFIFGEEKIDYGFYTWDFDLSNGW